MATRLEALEGALVEADKAGNVEDAKRLAQAIVTLRSGQHKPADAMDGVGTGQRLMEGLGQGLTNFGRGVGQRMGIVSADDVAEARKVDAPLLKTGAGSAGSAVGNIIPALATLAVPGANTVGGAAAVGGAIGALQPTTADESVLQNAGIGAALGGTGQYALGKAAKFLGDRVAAATAKGATQQSQNAVRDATLKASQEAGYSIPPSQAGSGLGARILEGVSGKYKTNQLAGIKNQNVTDSLARRALGLGEDAPLTGDTMKAVREAAFKRGYEPLANAGPIETDRVFQSSLDHIVKDYRAASRSFPGDQAPSDIMKMVDGLRTGSFDVGDALAKTRILRQEADTAYAAGNKALGKATKEASKAIEDQIERALENAGQSGKEMLKEFRDARTLMAKAHSVERALIAEGGKVNAKVLGAALQRGKPLSDELKTIGAFANNFKDVAGVPQSGHANPFTIMDFGFGTATGSPALPLARVGARYGILSQPFQQRMGPSYGPGMLEKMAPEVLEELRRRGVAGLLGEATQK